MVVAAAAAVAVKVVVVVVVVVVGVAIVAGTRVGVGRVVSMVLVLVLTVPMCPQLQDHLPPENVSVVLLLVPKHMQRHVNVNCELKLCKHPLLLLHAVAAVAAAVAAA